MQSGKLKRDKMKQIDYVCDCPGGWYGNNPNAQGEGCVVIDPTYTVSALRWFRRRATVMETKIKDDGLLLVFTVRGHVPELIA